jgi:acetoin utilization protein AcuB
MIASKSQIHCVGEFMTPNPCTTDASLTIADALDRMFANRIRHLLVVVDNLLVGVVSNRDLALASSIRSVDPSRTPISAAMTSQIYACEQEAPLHEVAWHMESGRYGCAVVLDKDSVVGVFTTIDALRALRELATGQAAEPARLPSHLPVVDDEPRVGLQIRVGTELWRSHAAPTAHQGTIR